MSQKAVFLDRDGTLNVDVAYLYEIDKFQWIPEAKEALVYLAEKGYLLFVVTNQSGVARGYFGEAEVKALHEHIQKELAPVGVAIEKFYYCPHLKDGTVAKYAVECDCRKPKPGMILQACAEYDIDKQQSFLVGDGARDVESAEAAGIRGYRYTGGSLLEFVKRIVEG